MVGVVGVVGVVVVAQTLYTSTMEHIKEFGTVKAIGGTNADIYHMVENAYKVTLVGAFVPLACGVYWKRATNLGGILSVVMGLLVWIMLENVSPDATLPPQLGDVSVTFADIHAAQSEIGYRPSVSLGAGIRQFVDWYCAYKGHSQAPLRHSA